MLIENTNAVIYGGGGSGDEPAGGPDLPGSDQRRLLWIGLAPTR
jgi:hypothetical protein